MNEKQSLILALVAVFVFNRATNDLEADDNVIYEMISQAVFPLILPAHKISAAIIANNMQVSYEHTELHELLTENSIPYVILNGIASASYYPTPILRTMGDVDFLINSADIPRVASMFAL